MAREKFPTPQEAPKHTGCVAPRCAPKPRGIRYRGMLLGQHTHLLLEFLNHGGVTELPI